jgi:stage V sporulation protein G
VEKRGSVNLYRNKMSDISISEVQIIPIKPRNGLVAFASCILNKSLYIGNIAIYTSPTSGDGYRLVYPARILPNGKEICCVHPINRETGRAISAAVIDRYKEILSRGGAALM